MAEKNDKARWNALPEYKVAICSKCGSLYQYRDKAGFAIFCAMYRFCPACGKKMTNAEAEQGERELKKMQETWWKKVMDAWREGEKESK